MEKIILAPQPRSTQCEILWGLAHLAPLCHSLSKRGAIVVDEKIAKIHGLQIQKILHYDLIAIPAVKTREAKQALEDQLLKRNLGKDTVIVGVGGGVTTDLVGFVASTYMRGVPLVLVPTTLLGMVDAAIGGKTGVDTSFGKNTVGSLYLPKAVVVDVGFLKTLDEREKKNGMSEILKYGLIANREIWDHATKWDMEKLIHASIACKVEIVSRDFDEKTGLRHVLNFGHTVGHALELLSNYQMAHGEAVALGCMAESYLSHLLGYLDQIDPILDVYRKLGYSFKKFDPKALQQAMAMDKKAKENKPRFVLIDRIGHAMPFEGAYCRSVEKEMIEKMITWMERDAR